MPASRRVSLKDREDRDRSVRRALDAFLTPPEAAVTNVTDVTDVADVSDVTNVPHVADVTEVTDVADVPHVTDGPQPARDAFDAEEPDPAHAAPLSAPRRAARGRVVTAQPDALSDVRRFDAPAPFVLKGRRFDPPAGARKRQNYALSAETIKRIALVSAYAGVGKAELVDAVLCAALRDLLDE